MDDEPAERRFWERTAQVPTVRAVGGPPAPEAGAGDLRPRPPAQPVRPPRRGARDAGGARGGPRPRHPHDRLRAPVRDLQARSAAVQRPRPPRPHPVGRGAAGPDRLRGQGPPGRPAGPGRDPGHLQPLAQRQAPRPGVHPRGLRHPDRALPRAGRGRLAQQPAPPARGVGDVRHEGRRQRRAQHERPRRLVGRGLDRRQRLGHRRPRDEPGRGLPGLGRRAGPVPDPGAGAHPGLLRARRRRPPRAVGAAHAQLHRQHHLALLDHAHAPRVRGAPLPAGRGRDRSRRAVTRAR